jgi:glycosyltransferase involved in cell wall biosynthesis
MSFTVGIGIVTYNRREILSGTIDTVRAFTRQPNAALVVADDGSTDGTQAMLREKQVPMITGSNRGIAWNKNRALFLLSHMLGCETVILLEDDMHPTRTGWEAAWMNAARRWGHVNYAGKWMRDRFISGSGTSDDPYICKDITAQCASFSSVALTYGGYFDPRFTGYGYEHVEHSRRLVRVGYGGTEERIDGRERTRFYLIEGDLVTVSSKSFINVEQEERNFQLASDIMGVQGYRSPWGPDDEMRLFRSEIENAMTGGPERFRLTPAEPRSGGSERFRLTPAEPGAPLVQPVEPGFISRMLQRS